VKKYHLLLLQLARFSLLVRCDQTSLLLFRELCPDTPGPVVASTLCAFMSYKMCECGTEVKHHLTKEVVRSHLGHTIYAEGSWNEQSTLEALQSALSHLHNLYPQILGSKLPYKPDCLACAKLFSQHVDRASTPRPCNHCFAIHGSTSQVLATGCVLNDRGYMTHYTYMMKLMKQHLSEGCVQLLPRDVRHFRSHLLHESPADPCASLRNLQVYCMILVGINLFLRAHELLNLKFSDFVPALTCFNEVDKKINYLVFQVKGKTDVHLHHLKLWSNQSHPELCPVTHLLVYIAMADRTDGHIFPSFFNGQTSFSYDRFLETIKHLCVNVAGYKFEKRIFGTHTLRKTAYLFATYGSLEQMGGNPRNLEGIPLSDIGKSARHKTLNNSATYSLDCVSRYRTEKASPPSHSSTQNLYLEWNPILMVPNTIREFERATRQRPTILSNLPLHLAANWFYGTKLKLNKASSVLAALETATHSQGQQQHSPRYAFQALHAMIVARFSFQEVVTANGYMQQMMSSNENDGHSAGSSIIVPFQPDQQSLTLNSQTHGAGNSMTTNTTSPPVCSPSPKKRRHVYGHNDLPFRKKVEWDKLDFPTKVRKLVECSKLDRKVCTAGGNTFRYTTATPVAWCVQHCHDNDQQKFVDHLLSIGISTINKGQQYQYKCNKCPPRPTKSTGSTKTSAPLHPAQVNPAPAQRRRLNPAPAQQGLNPTPAQRQLNPAPAQAAVLGDRRPTSRGFGCCAIQGCAHAVLNHDHVCSITKCPYYVHNMCAQDHNLLDDDNDLRMYCSSTCKEQG
jgi:hypothetical protein